MKTSLGIIPIWWDQLKAKCFVTLKFCKEEKFSYQYNKTHTKLTSIQTC